MVLRYRLIETSASDEEFEAHFQTVMAHRETLRKLILVHLPYIQADGQQAVRLVRSQADSWKIDPNRIGILGFSAGGHLAANVMLHHDPDSRPDFGAFIYGVLTGPVQVPLDAAPLFLAWANDDPLGD